jgi:hypothetical protein
MMMLIIIVVIIIIIIIFQCSFIPFKIPPVCVTHPSHGKVISTAALKAAD